MGKQSGLQEETEWTIAFMPRPKYLNTAILREHHAIPTLEEILPKLHKAKFFSMVDAKCGYWNVILDKESSYLATFNSPFGRYRFKRMPFGLNMSQDIFQAKIDQTFEGCRGVLGIADDIVISGPTEEEHDQNLRSMMGRCQETGLRLTPDKCHIKQEKIKFYGLICGPEGIQTDPDKVSALKQMAPPANSKELQTFLGLATYMAPFIPNLSHHTASLRQLLKKESKFAWDASQQDVFDRIKNLISEEVTLTYFDPEKETVLQVDASTKGLGATLLQEDKPVAFASKALTDVESRYANIEQLYTDARNSTLTSTAAVLQSNLTINPLNLSTLSTLHHPHSACNGCCCAYSRTALQSSTVKEQIWKSQMPCQDFRPRKQSLSLTWIRSLNN